MKKTPNSFVRYLLIPVHFLLPHVFRIAIILLGYVIYFFFISDLLTEFKQTENIISFIIRNGESLSFPLIPIVIVLIFSFLVIRIIGENTATYLSNMKIYWIVFSLSCISLILTIISVDYQVVGIPWWLDFVLCIYIMTAYGIGSSSKNQDNVVNSGKTKKHQIESNTEDDPYDILRQDVEQKVEEIKREKKNKQLWAILAIVIVVALIYLLANDRLNTSLTCDDGYELASAYEITDKEECKEYFEEGDARECCEVFVVEGFANSEDYFTNPDKNYFKGYECTDDCSGHIAGYDWAEANDIKNKDKCTGKSQSFIEGCYSYVEENYYYIFE